MGRNFFWIAFLLCGFADLFFAENSTAENLRIGLIAPLTGPIQQHGQAVLAGLKTGLEQGSCTKSVSLFAEDDGFDPKRTVGAARKILDIDHVQILLTVGSGPSHAVASFTDTARIPLLALAGDASVARNHPFVIRLRKPAFEEGHEIAALAKSSGGSRVALICNQGEFTTSVCEGIQKELGNVVVYRGDILPDTTDFRTEILKIKNANPTHVIPILFPGKLGLFSKQLAELHMKVPLFGGVFFESTSDLEISGGALIGARYVMPDTPDGFQKSSPLLAQVSPGSLAWAAIFYDVGRLLCAYPKSDERGLEYLRSLKNFSATVGTITFRDVAGDQYLDYSFVNKAITPEGFVRIVGRSSPDNT